MKKFILGLVGLLVLLALPLAADCPDGYVFVPTGDPVLYCYTDPYTGMYTCSVGQPGVCVPIIFPGMDGGIKPIPFPTFPNREIDKKK